MGAKLVIFAAADPVTRGSHFGVTASPRSPLPAGYVKPAAVDARTAFAAGLRLIPDKVGQACNPLRAARLCLAEKIVV